MRLLLNYIPSSGLVLQSAFVFSAVNSILPLISLYIYARMLSPAVYGNFTAAMVVISVFSTLVGFSFGPAIVKERDDRNKSLYLRIILLSAVISSIILLTSAENIGVLLSNSSAGALLHSFFWLPGLIAISSYFQFLQVRDLKTLRVLFGTFISYCLSYFVFGFIFFEQLGDEYVLLS